VIDRAHASCIARTAMRIFSLAFVITIAASLAGCGNDGPTKAACPPDADILNSARCTPGVDTTCRLNADFDCTCICSGYWECDQVLVRCDAAIPDLGTPRDLANPDLSPSTD
jgi:predicted small lipoprotein YifL